MADAPLKFFGGDIDQAKAAGKELIDYAEAAIQRQREALMKDLQSLLNSLTIRVTK